MNDLTYSLPMSIARACSTVVTWFASLALVLSSLVPLMSQALEGNGGSPWTEICTAQGSKLFALSDAPGEPAPVAPAEHLLEHCPFCSLHMTALGMPPALLSVPALAPLGHTVPELMLQAPRTLFAWATAQPRGPPSFS